MRSRIASSFAALTLAFASACSSDSTAPLSTATDAAHAADQFAQLADSVSRAGGDADVSGAYLTISGIVRMGGRVSPVSITIDGVATSFMATAISTSISDVKLAFAGSLRSLIAWDPANPKRVVQLSSFSDDEPIAAVLFPTFARVTTPMASLVYLDGNRGVYFGTNGTQKFSETLSTTPCSYSLPDSARTLIYQPIGCMQSNFTIAFDAKVEPSQFLVANNSATGTHTITMSAQSVAGSHIEIKLPNCDSTCVLGPNVPQLPSPPVVVHPSAVLPASLSTSVDSVVTMTLTVTNPSAQPITVRYPSSMKYDFIVTDSASGRVAWQSSFGKGVTFMIVDEIVPGNGKLVFTERWKPAARGNYLVHGLLASISHRAEAYASVVVP